MLFKKNIKAVSTLDLRNYTPKALSKIGSITACAIVLLPENPTPEFMEAFSKIKQTAVGFIINTDNKKTVSSFNGINIVSGNDINDNCVCLCNGVTFIHSTNHLNNAEFIFNGMVIKKSGSSYNCLTNNGSVVEWDYDETKIKKYIDSIDVDAMFLRNCEDDTVIASVNKINLADDITEEDIVSRNIRFVAVNEVVCNSSIYGCVASRSAVVNKVTVRD